MSWSFQNGKVYLNDQEIEPVSQKKLTEMKEVLLDQLSSGPDPVYFVYKADEDPEVPTGMVSEATLLSPGLIGREYCKTFGHYHVGDGIETYVPVAGHGVLLLQKPNFNYEEVEAVRIIHLEVGQKIEIPVRWGHLLVNTGSTPLVVADYRNPQETDHLYAPFSKKRGGAYYIIEDKGQMSIEPNPRYNSLPKPTTI